MKKILFPLALLLLACSTPSTTYTSSPEKRIYLNEDSEKISFEEFNEKWRDKSYNLFRWDYIENNNRIATLSPFLYDRYMISYTPFRKNLEKITGKKFNENTTFLIHYNFANDLCNFPRDPKPNKDRIYKKASFTRTMKKLEQENENLKILTFFEQGIVVSNMPNQGETEFYYMDKDNFLRKSVFKKPALCGSFAIVKPSDEALVRNGEYLLTWMAEHLEPKTWALFFE